MTKWGHNFYEVAFKTSISRGIPDTYFKLVPESMKIYTDRNNLVKLAIQVT